MYLIIDFFEKVETMNSASYYQLLRQNLPYLFYNPYIYIYISLTALVSEKRFKQSFK